MSSHAPLHAAPPEPAPLDRLAALRGELDGLDDLLHDTLMRRAGVVAQIGALGVKGRTPLRPGREAAIIRRLLARHAGPFPHAGIVRAWRALINGFTAQQHPMLITVCDQGGSQDVLAAAREQFGAITPFRQHRTPAQAMRDVSAGVATAAVLPLPLDNETPAAAWWTALLQTGDPRIHVVARLPFWTARPEGAPTAQALVVAAAAPDPSGADRSLLGLELPLDVSRARLGAALAAAGFSAAEVILRRDPGASAAHALADVDGFVADADPRLPALHVLLRPPVVVGAYAIPVPETPA
ncbi:MAG TPA: chorismate mutase [Acetobacteraceae bacterium]